MGDTLFAIGFIGAMVYFVISTIRNNRKAKRDSEKLNKICKAMGEANKYAEPGTPEHAKKIVELFEKEEKKKER